MIANLANREAAIRQLTPLQKELSNIAKKLSVGTVIIALVLALISMYLQFSVYESFIFGIGIAAAMVPQGLPAQVTVALSLAATRLAKKNALVKDL